MNEVDCRPSQPLRPSLIMKGIFCRRKHLLLRECWHVMAFPTSDTNPADVKTSIDYSRTTLRITFGVIASLALLGNGLVCAVILRSRTMLKNSYNLMILALAFTDMFTGKVHVTKAKLNAWSRNSAEHKQTRCCKPGSCGYPSD